jgi:copper/silver efflux system protein
VLISVPFALVGSVWTLQLLHYPLSAPVWVGLLSTVGLAMQTGVVMVVYIDEAISSRGSRGTSHDARRDHRRARRGDGATAAPQDQDITTMAARLLRPLWAGGPGAEIMRRVAAPMIGGLATSAFLTLQVLPVLYTLWRQHQLRRANRLAIPIETVVGAVPAWARQ